jgi:hypothetical protein
MSLSNPSQYFKGIRVNISEDGEMVYEAEKIPFRPFEDLARLLDGPITEETLTEMQVIYDQLPDPKRPETWIDTEGLNLLRRFWAAQEANDEPSGV